MTAAVTPGRDEYQPRTPERLIEILRARNEQPRSIDCEAASTIERLLTRLAAKPVEEEVDYSFDLRETLRAVLEFWGVDGAAKVARHVMTARRSRDSNAEIDRLEEVLSTTGEPERDGPASIPSYPYRGTGS